MIPIAHSVFLIPESCGRGEHYIAGFSLWILSRGYDQNTSTVGDYFYELDDGVKGTSFMNILIKDCAMAFLHLSKLHASKNPNMAYDRPL